jgi:hypothetical protein
MYNETQEIASLVETYLAVSSLRPRVLFEDFLPTGYRFTTIDSVDSDFQSSVILAKLHLGMMITLYDDLADNPENRDGDLLNALYKLNVGRDLETPLSLSGERHRTFELARYLFQGLQMALRRFPQYSILAPVLQFDIEQFYVCNRHSELISVLPAARNVMESQTIGHHNMGIVAAGVIDLMASPGLRLAELGQCREVFLLGQRLGRISNLIFTLKRELLEGDTTNEMLFSASSTESNLLHEFKLKRDSICAYTLQSFNTTAYASGLDSLHRLHASLEGKI